MTATLAGLWHPAAAAVGASVGFWLVWTVHAASTDATGRFVIGSMLPAVGLAGGTAVATALGVGVRAARGAARRRRSAGDTRSGVR